MTWRSKKPVALFVPFVVIFRIGICTSLVSSCFRGIYSGYQPKRTQDIVLLLYLLVLTYLIVSQAAKWLLVLLFNEVEGWSCNIMDFRKFHLRVSFTNQMCSFRFFSHAAGRKADMMSFAHRLLVLHLVRRSGRTRLLFACLRQLCAHCLTCLRSQLSANTVLHPHRQKMFLANA